MKHPELTFYLHDKEDETLQYPSEDPSLKNTFKYNIF